MQNSKSNSINKQNTLKIKKSPTLKKSFLSTVFNCHNPLPIKLLTQLQLSLNHLLEHIFKLSLAPLPTALSWVLCRKITQTNSSNILENNDFAITWILFCGDTSFNDHTNTHILDLTNEYIILTKRFYESLLTCSYHCQISHW